MNYKLLFQMEAEQNKLLHRKLKEYEKEIEDLKVSRDFNRAKYQEHTEALRELTSRITSYTSDSTLEVMI